MVWIYGIDTPGAKVQNQILSRVVLQERQLHDASRAIIQAKKTTYENLLELSKTIDNIFFGIGRQALNWSTIRNENGALVAALINMEGIDSMVQSLFQGGPKTLEDTIRILHKTASMCPSLSAEQRKWFTVMQKFITSLTQKDNIVSSTIFSQAALNTNQELVAETRRNGNAVPQVIYEAVSKAMRGFNKDYGTSDLIQSDHAVTAQVDSFNITAATGKIVPNKVKSIFQGLVENQPDGWLVKLQNMLKQVEEQDKVGNLNAAEALRLCGEYYSTLDPSMQDTIRSTDRDAELAGFNTEINAQLASMITGMSTEELQEWYNKYSATGELSPATMAFIEKDLGRRSPAQQPAGPGTELYSQLGDIQGIPPEEAAAAGPALQSMSHGTSTLGMLVDTQLESEPVHWGSAPENPFRFQEGAAEAALQGTNQQAMANTLDQADPFQEGAAEAAPPPSATEPGITPIEALDKWASNIGNATEPDKRTTSILNLNMWPALSTKRGTRLGFGKYQIYEKSLRRTTTSLIITSGNVPVKLDLTPSILQFLESSPSNKDYSILRKDDAKQLLTFVRNMESAGFDAGSASTQMRIKLKEIQRHGVPTAPQLRRQLGEIDLPGEAQDRLGILRGAPASASAPAERTGSGSTIKQPIKLNLKTGQFGDLNIDLPALSVLHLIVRKGDRVVFRRKHINKDLLNMLLGKKVIAPSQNSIDQFKLLVRQSGLRVGGGHSVHKGSKELVARLKLLIGHIKSGGNAKTVKNEVSQIATVLQKQGHLSPSDTQTILKEYG